MAHIYAMRLRNSVRQHRARLELTQQQLADAVEVRRQTILAVEKGHYVPSTLLALRIATALRMRVEDLFELAGSHNDGEDQQ